MTTSKIDGGLPPLPRAAELTGAGGVQSRSGEDRSQPVGAAAAGDSLRLTGEAAGLQALQRELGGPAEIDLARVNAVRAALADGSYQIDAQQVAERLLALEGELSR